MGNSYIPYSLATGIQSCQLLWQVQQSCPQVAYQALNCSNLTVYRFIYRRILIVKDNARGSLLFA